MAWGQRRKAFPVGMADRTPKARASYEAEATTPRPEGDPPTITGLPMSDGSLIRSTET